MKRLIICLFEHYIESEKHAKCCAYLQHYSTYVFLLENRDIFVLSISYEKDIQNLFRLICVIKVSMFLEGNHLVYLGLR